MISIIKEKLRKKPSTLMFLQMFAYELHLAQIRFKNKVIPIKKAENKSIQKSEKLKITLGLWINEA